MDRPARVARAGALAVLAVGAIARPAAADPIWVIDGDTIRVGREHIRLMGVDAAELHARCKAELTRAYEARGFLRGLIASGQVRIDRSPRHEKYGRTLAVVRVNGRDVAGLIVAAGLGRPYHGERRQSWCGER